MTILDAGSGVWCRQDVVQC